MDKRLIFMSRSNCTRSNWCNSSLCFPVVLPSYNCTQIRECRSKGSPIPPRSLTRFLPSALRSVVPHCPRTHKFRLQPKKKREDLPRWLPVVDPIDPLQIHDAVQLQNPTWAKSPLPLPLLSASHPLPSTTFPMSEFRKRLIYCSTHN